jgi:glycosyltransferase involved in cell wall biosynthesis
MSTPRISVIMPVFNTAAYLGDAINSILSQTLSDFEFIIINDGSTDGSEEVIKRSPDLLPEE